MKLTSLSGTPIVGTIAGQVYSAPGSTNIARTRVVPLQPKSNPQVTIAVAVAAAAQNWKLLTSADQALWTEWFGLDQAGYNAFVAVNSNAMFWGSSAVIQTPYAVLTPTIVFATLFAEPDGIHTTLAIAIGGTPIPPHECWCRLYINFQQRTFGKNSSSARSRYFGSFGPLAHPQVNLFDVTDLMLQATGQWWYPASLDTASHQNCGNQATCQFWATDQFGMPSDFGGPYPIKNQFAGILPGQLGAGVCPSLPGPPYPWPSSSAFYGDHTLVNIQTFSTPGTFTYTPTPGTSKVLIQLLGAGGGGSGVQAAPSGHVALGGAGSAGGFLQKLLTADFAGSSLTVPAGAAGGAAGANPGADAASATFTTSGGTPTTYTAPGGLGGYAAANLAPPLFGNIKIGGAPSGGDLNIPGGPSLPGYASNVFTVIGGSGGASQFGPGGLGQFCANATAVPGLAAPGHGGGGSGAQCSNSSATNVGGAGAPGLVVIYEFS
jgi:hypothetical protein